MRIKTDYPHISSLHMVRRCDESTGREEKILVVETDITLPKVGHASDDERFYAVLQQLENMKHDVEKTFGKFQIVEIRNSNDNRNGKNIYLPH